MIGIVLCTTPVACRDISSKFRQTSVSLNDKLNPTRECSSVSKDHVLGAFLIEKRVLRDEPSERIRIELDMPSTVMVFSRNVVDHCLM